jgi:hypothetical protein
MLKILGVLTEKMEVSAVPVFPVVLGGVASVAGWMAAGRGADYFVNRQEGIKPSTKRAIVNASGAAGGGLVFAGVRQFVDPDYPGDILAPVVVAIYVAINIVGTGGLW